MWPLLPVDMHQYKGGRATCYSIAAVEYASDIARSLLPALVKSCHCIASLARAKEQLFLSRVDC